MTRFRRRLALSAIVSWGWPYLVNPRQASIRSFNFTQVGPNTQAEGAINGPCTISTSCTQIPVTKTVCEDNNGTWWGQGADAPLTEGIPLPDGLKYCCQVNQFLYANAEPMLDLQPLRSVAVRNDSYKVVRNSYRGDPQPDPDSAPGCDVQVSDEFYAIDEAVPLPRIDRAELNLMQLPVLTPKQQANYSELTAQLVQILASQPPCIGDGNIDGVVDGLDVADWADFAKLSEGNSSWHDINQDGFTDGDDLAIIKFNQGADCAG